jgi:OmpA-OmpF porin, OOP family
MLRHFAHGEAARPHTSTLILWEQTLNRNFSPRLGAIALAVLGAAASGQAFAQPIATPHWYLGGNIGRTSADFDPPALPAPILGVAEDDKDKGYKLYGGYQFHRNFAVEGGYFDLGDFDYAYGTGVGTFAGNSRYRGLNLDLVGRVPFGDRFSAFARVGAAYTRARATLGGGSFRDNDFGVKYGLGLEFAITQALSLRGEVERYRIDDPVRNRGHVDMASLGLVYRFGAPAVVPTRVVAPPPPPPPPPAPAPAAPRPYRN